LEKTSYGYGYGNDENGNDYIDYISGTWSQNKKSVAFTLNSTDIIFNATIETSTTMFGTFSNGQGSANFTATKTNTY